MLSSETEIFTVGASAYVKAEARRLFLRFWWIPAIAVDVPLFIGLFDNRFIYLALMLLFIAIPMFLSLAWMSLAARSSVQWLSRPQRWRCSGETLQIDFYPFDHRDGEVAPIKVVSISADMVDSVADDGKFVSVTLNKDNPLNTHFLLIPSGLLSLDFLITDNEI